MAKLLSINKKLPVRNKKVEDMHLFLDFGLFVDIDLKNIYEQAKNYTYENDSK